MDDRTPYMTEVALWRLLSGAVSRDELARMRRRREGPAYIPLGRGVLYDRRDVERWLRGRRVDPSISLN